jgi:hypothetical protein
MITRWVAILAALAALTGVVSAQSAPGTEFHRFSVMGHAGAEIESGEDNEKGSEFAYGVSAGGFASERWLFRFNWERAGNFQPDHVNNFLEFNAVYHFRPRSTVQPYVAGGVGVLHTQWERAGYRGSQSDLAGTAGGGVRILLGKRADMRVEYLLTGVVGLAVHRIRVGFGFLF